MKTESVKKSSKAKIGTLRRITKGYKVFSETVRVVDAETGDLLAVFLKKVITEPLVTAGRDLIKYKASTTNRVDAGGICKSRAKTYPKGSLGRGNSVNSSLVGFSEAHGPYRCRMTKLYRDNFQHFNKEILPLVRFINKQYKKHAPSHYSRQRRFANRINQKMRLGKTAFTTCTVNVDFRTRTHRDQGDLQDGFGNLCVFQTGSFSGGELMLPEYKIAFNLEEGDLLLFDVHQIHCNNTIKGKGRVSLVCYAREKIEGKCDGLSTKTLRNNVTMKGRKKKGTK